jgi:hypothetical protein
MRRALLNRVAYRSSQFFKAVGARVNQEDRVIVESVLETTAQRALFDRMPAADQRHAVALLRTLRTEGHDHPALMQAALLHDVAKSRAGITVFHRVIVVLLRAFLPGWLAWLVHSPDGSLSRLRRPFAQYLEHPSVGAEWAEAAGCLPMAVSIIRRHQSPVPALSLVLEDQFLRSLQAADDKN